jgi:acyl-coenzyme A synthetase/AMP-(fatty) acid ligase
LSDDRQPPPRFNGARYCLEANARERGDKPALVMVGDNGRTDVMTFTQVDRAVRGVAAGLRGLGLPAGARVMIMTAAPGGLSFRVRRQAGRPRGT